jgi:ADP-heptose:LPS heptosyltransferase
VKSVLFVRLSAMGDLVQSLGAVASLHAVRPDLRLTFVTQKALEPLLEGVPGVARVVGFERGAGLRGLRCVRDRLREDRYDAALDLQGNWKSALVALLSRAVCRIGAAAPARQEPWSRCLLHRTVPIEGVPHPARVAWRLVCSLAPDAVFVPPRLRARDDEVARERRAVRAAGLDPDRPFEVVVVTDPADPRALRPAVLSRRRGAALPPLLLLGPHEAHLPVEPGSAVLRHGANEPRRLIALGEVLRAAGGRALGPDQGAMHVLAAAGASCFVAFGAQDPCRTAPPAAVALVHPHPPSCSPCRRRRCWHPSGPVCMDFDPADGRRVDVGLPAGPPP